jgi:hypothetical protein
VHLVVGFIIRIDVYHDARSSECQRNRVFPRAHNLKPQTAKIFIILTFPILLSYMNINDIIKDDYTVLDRSTCGIE